MRKLQLNHSIRHMFATLSVFVLAILLLESGGLANWAGHLEPGPLRTAALPAASALNRILAPFGVAGRRDLILDEAARMGWSDDAVRLARATPSDHGAGPQGGGGRPSSKAKTIVPPESKSVLEAAAEAPIVGSVPRSVNLNPLTPIEQGRPRVVALTGDSMMAVGFGAGLMRKASVDRNLRILRAFKSGTGLARPDVFNWIDEYPAMVGSENPDVVIVAIGANDCQSFVVDDKVVVFGTEEWRKEYQSRVAEFLAMVERTGARVLWVGLPPMRSETFNQRISIVNRIAYTVVSQDPKASWWSTATYVGDASGSFQEFAELPNGGLVRLRASDGVHFTEEGASTMTTVLMKWLDPAPQDASGARASSDATSAGGRTEPEPTTVDVARSEPRR